MGLDICVYGSTIAEVSEYGWDDDQVELERLFNQSVEALGLKPNETVHTRPGSYGGLHVLRREYARHRGIDVGENFDWERGFPLADSHLCCHCDAEGFYLPDDFVDPIWAKDGDGGTSSIGSSVRLLKELRELDRNKLDGNALWAWDAVFVPAVASVKLGRVIYFR